MDDSIKRWIAKRKTALVIEIIQGKTTAAVGAWLRYAQGVRRAPVHRNRQPRCAI
ncbi:hypothetical protein [Acidimangrovimonas pyrenivorans]|uniref:Transposase n=1 Tax=Acidimangrovimonas pyrenivorans TaxID=2030798 RepID=A0ABV7AJB5_9RHOB